MKKAWKKIAIIAPILAVLLSNIDRLVNIMKGDIVIVKEETEYVDTTGIRHKTYIETTSDCKEMQKKLKMDIIERDKEIKDINNKIYKLLSFRDIILKERDSLIKKCDSLGLRTGIIIINNPVKKEVDTIYIEKDSDCYKELDIVADSIENRVRRKFLGIF